MKAARIGIVLIVASFAACGRGAVRQTSEAKPGDSAFCKVAVAWAAHELDPPPGASKTWTGYAQDYRKFLEEEARLAPAEIRDAAQRHLNDVKTTVDPVMRKYGYDPERVDKQATAEEKKILEEGPQGEALTAQNKVHVYEARTCGTGEPVPADAQFSGSAESAYCAAVGRIRADVSKLAEAGFPAEQTKTFYEGTFTAAIEEMANNPAPGREGDVKAIAAFVKAKQLPALAEHGYDIRNVLRQGSADDRLAANIASPEIYDAAARNSAYDDQVCTKG